VRRFGDGFPFDLKFGALWNDREQRVFSEDPVHFDLTVQDPLPRYSARSDSKFGKRPFEWHVSRLHPFHGAFFLDPELS